jgi:hemolysin activation/secretion protein
VVGKGKIYGTRYVIPMDASKRWTHSTTLGLDYKDVEDLVGMLGSVPLKTPIQYVVASAVYNATAYEDASTTRFSVGVNLGLRGPNSQDEFEDKRYKANPDFIYLRADVHRTDILPADFNVVTNIQLQLTDSPLISNEQFTAGGYLTVRGYLVSQILGDNGIAGRVELHSPDLLNADSGGTRIRLLAFLEGASVKTLEPLPGQQAHADIASTGAGLRVTKSKQLTIKLDWAYPLLDAGNEASGTLVSKGDSRLVFALAYSF